MMHSNGLPSSEEQSAAAEQRATLRVIKELRSKLDELEKECLRATSQVKTHNFDGIVDAMFSKTPLFLEGLESYASAPGGTLVQESRDHVILEKYSGDDWRSVLRNRPLSSDTAVRRRVLRWGR